MTMEFRISRQASVKKVPDVSTKESTTGGTFCLVALHGKLKQIAVHYLFTLLRLLDSGFSRV